MMKQKNCSNGKLQHMLFVTIATEYTRFVMNKYINHQQLSSTDETFALHTPCNQSQCCLHVPAEDQI